MLQAPIEKYSLDPRLACLKSCAKCLLSPKRGEAKQVVPGVGNLDAEILILAQNPGETEDTYGFPLIGPSFWFLKALKDQFGFDYLKESFITNSAMCLTKKLTGGQLNSCRQNLSFIIDKMPNLRIILTLGAVPLKVVEGDKSVLETRLGIPAKLTWVPAPFTQSDGRKLYFKKRELVSIPFYHPARLLREENPRKQRKLHEFMLFQMSFFINFRKKVRDIDSFELPYKFHFCLTPKESWDALEHIRRAEHIVVDYETSGIRCNTATPLLASFAISDWEVYCFFFNQIVDLPKSDQHKTKAKKGRARFTNKWKLAPWHESDPDFARKFMTSRTMVNILHSEVVTGYKNKPTIGAWNFTFDSNVNWTNFGYPICERQDQMCRLEDPFTTPFSDSMFAFRLANSDLKSISLETAVKYLSPLELSQKDFAETGLTKPQIREWGYALQARKPPNNEMLVKYGNEYYAFLQKHGEKRKQEWASDPEREFWLEEIERDFVVSLRKPKWEVLAHRACVDASIEFRLSKRIEELLQSNDMSAFNLSLRDLTNNIFL